MLKGIATSGGIAIGKVFKYEQPVIDIKEAKADINESLSILDKALEKTTKDIEKVKAASSLGEEELAVFDAHLMMANDPQYISEIKEKINEGYSADWAAKVVSDKFIKTFEALEDEYFKERAADVRDVSFRLICNILGKHIPKLNLIHSEVIVVANELTPSDTAQLNKKYALGFCTEIGGRTSHTAIMAASLGIPAVVGTTGILNAVEHGDVIIVDSIDGIVITKPTEEDIKFYTQKQENYLKETEALKSLVNEKTVTKDNHIVDIACNIGTPNDVKGVIDNGAEGIGLYRTEFLYMNSKSNFPTEEQQFEAYKVVLEEMKGKKVVVRTLDIGGDKKLDYFEFDKEMNPFLGYRAIRLCLDKKDIFRTQIRALLRASVYGKLAIMFPMIATLNEFIDAKSLVLAEKEQLIKEGKQVSDDIEIGMMVEIPAAAVLADEFAKYADFFSIGTNDLIQYSMAADRMSEKVSYLYQPLNPSVLRLIKMTIDGAHSQGKWCGMCGEMSGDSLAIPVLLGLGLDEFSMSANCVLKSRKLIKDLSFEEAKELASKAIACQKEQEVKELIRKSIK